ncbi:ribonuclease P protein subunit p30-like [Panonychus citri]|uniref:ribonuclease P protein subunit p30-like n=1 Tax=Panonychus citri TaxID=50023 RepID=UPI0023075BBD|nr:ribonuclease P protein subunit p30-like [Panonychus citri]
MDLNIIIERDSVRDNRDTILEKVKRCVKLGLKEIALNVCIDGANQLNSIPSPPQLSSYMIEAIGERRTIKLYTRLTVSVEDGLHLHKIGQSPVVKLYDLLALECKTEKVLTQILGGGFDCDILTFDFTEKSNFSWRKANFSLPITRGILLEINYCQAFSSQSNRHNFFSNSQNLSRKTKGKNILLSSGATNSMFLRGPYCVINLGLLFGLVEHRSKDAVFINGIKAIRHSEIRKNPATSAITLVDKLLPNEEWVKKELLVTTEVTNNQMQVEGETQQDQQMRSSPENSNCSDPKKTKIN